MMATSLHNTSRNHKHRSQQQNPMLSQLQRPHKKHLSRYKLKKQATIMEQIISDTQIMTG
jgi:hypothetical protein